MNYLNLYRKYGAVLALLLAFCLSFCGVAQSDPTLTVTGGGTQTRAVNVSGDISFDAVINNPPTVAGECSLTEHWDWSATYDGPASGTITGTGNSHGVIPLTLPLPGTYIVTVTTKAEYTSSCGGPKIVVTPYAKLFTAYAIGGNLLDSYATPGSKDLYHYGSAPFDVSVSGYVIDGPTQPPGTTLAWSTSASFTCEDQSTGTSPLGLLKAIDETPSTNAQGSEWVQLTYSLNGVTAVSDKVTGWTIFQPSSTRQLSVVHSPVTESDAVGFESKITYQVLDQWGEDMTKVKAINESFGTWISDYSGENWPTKTANGAANTSGIFFDTLGYVSNTSPTPLPAHPQSPLGSTKVEHVAQIFYAGSTTSGVGYPINIHTAQFYTDHGMHE